MPMDDWIFSHIGAGQTGKDDLDAAELAQQLHQAVAVNCRADSETGGLRASPRGP